MSIEQIEDHEEQGVSRLISQYQDTLDFEAFCRALLQEVQEAEDAIWTMFLARSVDTATGDLLRQIGRQVGQIYAGEDEDDYRKSIKVKIRTNRSHGQWRDLNLLREMLFDGFETVWERHGNMNLTLRIVSEWNTRPSLEQTILEKASTAGARVDIKYSTDAEASRFAFGSEGLAFDGGGLGGRVSSYDRGHATE